jgi:hypothetical protein
LTAPQVQEALALILHRACRCDTPERIAQERTRRLERNELARFYHYKARKLLPPLKAHQRE